MNTFGNRFRLTTFGESHGPALGGVIDGCPAGIAIDMQSVNEMLRRRREGDIASSCTTARKEPDQIEWLSGIYDGRTLGTPIAFLIRNKDCQSQDYDQLREWFRPGHADYTYQAKYGIRDHRGGGRASGRETAARVVAGAIAMQIIATRGITINSRTEGLTVVCFIENLPAGIGDPIFDKLNARLAYGMMSIPSAIAFEMGIGKGVSQLAHDQYADAWIPAGQGNHLTLTNHCGGVQGGISNGMPVQCSVTFHLPVTVPQGMACRNIAGEIKTIAPQGRHDSNHMSRCAVIVESMAALVIADLTL